jgi:hypothetical protein
VRSRAVPLVRVPRTLPRILPPQDSDRLVGALRMHRDRAMLLGMLLAGLRRCEVHQNEQIWTAADRPDLGLSRAPNGRYPCMGGPVDRPTAVTGSEPPHTVRAAVSPSRVGASVAP